ncbi:MAG: hypothetical protein HGA54_00015 [Actinobacteria bacterium]|nr:hypothetical protein [Actinomycetota bacterium]
MKFLVVLIVATIGVLLLKKAIKKYPWAFYAIAIVLDLFYILGGMIELPSIIRGLLFILMQKCTLSLALFVVVMYIGVFSKASKPSRYLTPIRGELSIIAWFLALGHMVTYLMSYTPRVLSGLGFMDVSIVVSLVIAILLFILLIVLGLTSFEFIKRRISLQMWKKIQAWAYVFFGLVYIHLMLLLLPSALSGGGTALISVVVYSVIFIGYLVARVVRALRDKTQ